MSRLIRDIAIPLGAPQAVLREHAAKALNLPVSDVLDVRVRKVSLDARTLSPQARSGPQRVYTLEVYTTGDDVSPDVPPELRRGSMRTLDRSCPIIVGTGPAGLWAALRFIEAGIPCTLIDRGGSISQRHDAVRGLRREGILNPESNLCFGAGGAGTYSDGKLFTRRRDPEIQRIHEDLTALGSPAEILVEAHPHVGTNRLIRILSRLEDFLADSGCELRYNQKVVGILRRQDGAVCGVRLADGTELESDHVILATGHSARDVYAWLRDEGIALERKPFAVGARCEHPQALIDKIQFGTHAENPELEPAEYFLTAQVGERGVYSFCMCPGGFVIPTTTEPLHLNVNGMSNHKRGSDFANAALVVTLEPKDFWIEKPGDLDHEGPLAGIALQRHLERRAYEAGGGGYNAPAQRLTDFLDRKVGDLPERTSYRPSLNASDLNEVLPARVTQSLARALFRFDQRMKGYLTREAILIGVETTTSSPVRIVRDDNYMSPTAANLYPTGEGAGAAGGIVSSALDGLRVAEAILGKMGLL